MNLEEARLEKQRIVELVRKMENEEYVNSEVFKEDLDDLIRAADYGLDALDLPLQEKIQRATEAVKKTSSDLSSALWEPRGNGC